MCLSQHRSSRELACNQRNGTNCYQKSAPPAPVANESYSPIMNTRSSPDQECKNHTGFQREPAESPPHSPINTTRRKHSRGDRGRRSRNRHKPHPETRSPAQTARTSVTKKTRLLKRTAERRRQDWGKTPYLLCAANNCSEKPLRLRTHTDMVAVLVCVVLHCDT